MQFEYEYQDTTKNLTDTAEKELLSTIPKKYDSWNDKRQKQIDDVRKIRNVLYEIEQAKAQGNWEHSFKQPDLIETKQTLLSNIWQNVYQDPEKMFDAKGQNVATQQTELQQKASLVYSLNKMKVGNELDKCIDDLADTGDIAMFTGWAIKKKKIRRKNALGGFDIIEKTTFDGAKVSRIDPMGLVFNEDKSVYIYRNFVEPSKLQADKNNKISDIKELKNIATGEKDDNTPRNKDEDIVDTSLIAKDGKIEVLEYWGDITLDDGTELKDWFISVAGRRQIIRFEANPYIGIKPFVYTNWCENPSTGRGVPFLKVIYELSQLSNELLNKQIDALALIMNPPYLAPKGCFKGEQTVKPGKIIEYDAALMPTAPQALSFDKAMQGWEFLNYFKASMENATGVFKNMQGETEGGETTATEIKARIGGQSARLSYLLDIINQAIIQMIENVAELNASFKYGTEIIRGTVKGQSTFLEINDDIRNGEYDYTYSDSTAIQDKKHRAKEFGEILAQFMANPIFAQEIDPMKAFIYITEQFGFEDAEDKIKRDIPNEPTGTIPTGNEPTQEAFSNPNQEAFANGGIQSPENSFGNGISQYGGNLPQQGYA